MVRHLLTSIALGAAIVWWLLADLSTTVAVVTGVPLLLATVALGALMSRRARRLRSVGAGYLPQTITHDGNFIRRLRTDDPKDIETHLGAGW
jgi:hypothetical protein